MYAKYFKIVFLRVRKSEENPKSNLWTQSPLTVYIIKETLCLLYILFLKKKLLHIYDCL